jgi:hypothetical protein
LNSVIARKDGEQVRLWARTTSDYSNAFTRIRDAVAALPVDSAVLDGKAIVLRPDHTSDFDGLRSRRGKPTFLVTYEIHLPSYSRHISLTFVNQECGASRDSGKSGF